MAFTLFKHVFKVKKGEQLDLKITLPEDNRGVVHGVVFDSCDRPVENAVVKLFKLKNECECENEHKHEHEHKEMCPVTHTFTDEHGQFLFGPLCADEHYAIKIWADGVCVKCEKVDCGVCLRCLKCKCCDKEHDICCCLVESDEEKVEKTDDEIYEAEKDTAVVNTGHNNHNRRPF